MKMVLIASFVLCFNSFASTREEVNRDGKRYWITTVSEWSKSCATVLKKAKEEGAEYCFQTTLNEKDCKTAKTVTNPLKGRDYVSCGFLMSPLCDYREVTIRGCEVTVYTVEK